MQFSQTHTAEHRAARPFSSPPEGSRYLVDSSKCAFYTVEERCEQFAISTLEDSMLVKRFLAMFIVLIAALFLAACAESEPELPGDPVRGEQLYNRQNIGSKNAAGCLSCHSLEEGETLEDWVFTGPSHYAIGVKAKSAVPGMAAEEYLRQSIVDPNAHITEGFEPWIMYPRYAEDLTEQDIDDLVSYLLTLE
jgi:mono/diheme cytochrome c family protein